MGHRRRQTCAAVIEAGGSAHMKGPGERAARRMFVEKACANTAPLPLSEHITAALCDDIVLETSPGVMPEGTTIVE